MSATKDGVLGRPKAKWTRSHDAYLIELFIEQHKCGPSACNEFKNEVFKSVTRDFNEKFGLNLKEDQMKNRYITMKKDYFGVLRLLCQDGFVWDETLHMVVAEDKVWESYIAVRSSARTLRRKTFPLFTRKDIMFGGERLVGKYKPTSSLRIGLEDGNSNSETIKSSEPSNLPIQVVDGGAHDSDSNFHMINAGLKKRKSISPTNSIRKRGAQNNVEKGIKDASNEMLSSAKFKVGQRRSIVNERIMYHKCLEELQKLEELDDLEFTKAVNVLKDDKNAIAFMAIKGPRRLIWLKSLWQD